MATTAKQPPSYLDPDRLYTYRGFQVCSGINPTRIREARLQGVTPTLLKVGKRIFIRGADAIAFVESLARLSGRSS